MGIFVTLVEPTGPMKEWDDPDRHHECVPDEPGAGEPADDQRGCHLVGVEVGDGPPLPLPPTRTSFLTEMRFSTARSSAEPDESCTPLRRPHSAIPSPLDPEPPQEGRLGSTDSTARARSHSPPEDRRRVGAVDGALAMMMFFALMPMLGMLQARRARDSEI